jgi:hypothetical protein
MAEPESDDPLTQEESMESLANDYPTWLPAAHELRASLFISRLTGVIAGTIGLISTALGPLLRDRSLCAA